MGMSDHGDDHSHDDDHGHDDHGHDEEHSHDDHGHDDHSHDDDHHDHGEPGTHEHHHHDVETLGVAVLTVSSSRGLDDDAAGDSIVDILEDAGHELVTRELVGDDHDTVQSAVHNLVGRSDVDTVVSTGGTGVTPDDVTVEAAQRLFAKELPGFGELFRQRSYEEVGTMVVATRATAGIAEGTPVFCLPGSENAATLGAELVADTAGHLRGLASRDEEDEE
jgi:molybdenum cofactor biosynthesis protein B